MITPPVRSRRHRPRLTDYVLREKAQDELVMKTRPPGLAVRPKLGHRHGPAMMRRRAGSSVLPVRCRGAVLADAAGPIVGVEERRSPGPPLGRRSAAVDKPNEHERRALNQQAKPRAEFDTAQAPCLGQAPTWMWAAHREGVFLAGV